MKIRKTIAATSAAALALSLAACADNDSDSDASGSDGDKGTITLGYLPSWTDGLSTAYLLENKLEAAGYDVERRAYRCRRALRRPCQRRYRYLPLCMV